MAENVKIQVGEKTLAYPVITGNEQENAVDMTSFRADTGYISYDEGYGNTGPCKSAITFINGEQGILRYRDYPIEQLAKGSSFLETAYLIIYAELPTEKAYDNFRNLIIGNASINESMLNHYQGFPHETHPMAVLSSMMNVLGCYYPEMASNNRARDLEYFDSAAAILIRKVDAL